MGFFDRNKSRALESVKAALVEASKAEASSEEVPLPQVEAVPRTSDGSWNCDLCGKVFLTKGALGAHKFSRHRVTRWARRAVVDSTCPICMRRYANRSKVLEHIHEESTICKVNLRLWNYASPDWEVEAADKKQAAQEKAAALRGDHKRYGSLSSQACGPMRTIVIPLAHSRKSNSKLMRRALKCEFMAREIDCDGLQVLLGIAEGNELEVETDDFPLDVLQSVAMVV